MRKTTDFERDGKSVDERAYGIYSKEKYRGGKQG